MRAEKIMTKDVGGIMPEATLWRAAHKMKSLGVGILPISDGESIVGVITDRDIVIRAISKGVDPKKAMVKKYMTRKVFTCFTDNDLKELASIMKRKKVRRLLVMNRKNKLMGIVSLADIAVYPESRAAYKILKEVSRPAQPRRGR